MWKCPDCGRRVAERQDFCPRCWCAATNHSSSDPQHAVAAEWDVTAGEPAITIARFHNAAEAGFFAHELMQREALEVQLSLDEIFEELGERWRIGFLLKVPQAQAELAAETLQQLIEQTEADEWQSADCPAAAIADDIEPESATTADRFPLESGSMHWVPIVLTLAAGSFVLWAARKPNEPPERRKAAPARSEHAEFWRDLPRGSQPWVQRLDNQVGVRKLWIDPERNEAVLREDADGDGQFETLQRFPEQARGH